MTFVRSMTFLIVALAQIGAPAIARTAKAVTQLPSGLPVEIVYEPPVTEETALQNGLRIARDAWADLCREKTVCERTKGVRISVSWYFVPPDRQACNVLIEHGSKDTQYGVLEMWKYKCGSDGKVYRDDGEDLNLEGRS